MKIQPGEAFAELEHGVQAVLETYSNVHRGSGQASMVSTHLFEQAREIVLESLGLNKDKYTVIFCTPRRAELLKARINPKRFQCLSSLDIGLPVGVSVLAGTVEVDVAVIEDSVGETVRVATLGT